METYYRVVWHSLFLLCRGSLYHGVEFSFSELSCQFSIVRRDYLRLDHLLSIKVYITHSSESYVKQDSTGIC